MAAANAGLLQTLSKLWRTRADASVSIDSGRIVRTLHLRNGEFVAADSDVLTERLGVLLVAEGKLDVALVDPIVQAARASGRYFGDQLVADGVLEGSDVTRALSRQAALRFDRSVQMVGEVTVGPIAQVRTVCRFPVGAMVVTGFRSRLPLEAATSLVATLTPNRMRMDPGTCSPEELQLSGPELRCWRQLASGQDASAVLDRAPDYEAALRLIAALVALGAIGGSEARDPVAELLRSA